jgi:hypothetical protein
LFYSSLVSHRSSGSGTLTSTGLSEDGGVMRNEAIDGVLERAVTARTAPGVLAMAGDAGVVQSFAEFELGVYAGLRQAQPA